VSLVSYSIPVNIQRLQCIISKQTSSKQHVLALACVADLVGASSLAAVKTSPKKCLLVLGTSWLQNSFSMHHAHPSFLSFTCSTYKESKASMQKQSKNNAKSTT
jgi:hypothetical protein